MNDMVMYDEVVINDVHAREILDSRGNPTVEVEVALTIVLFVSPERDDPGENW